MHSDTKRLEFIQNKIKEILSRKQLKTNPKIIAVTKTWSANKIIPLIDSGHIHFGENKIQEAETKWPGIKSKYNNLQLHMLGRLQSNKAKKAVEIFDYIHSLDSEKLATKLNKFENELNKKIKLFIQVNMGNESQKSGISINDLDNFYNFCKKDLSLNVIGLMCLPPINSDPSKYFKILKNISERLNIANLSMGMSADYEQAILYGSTYLRLGTVIFGERKIT